MKLTQSIFHRDFIELSSDEEDFKEEPLRDVANEVFITFSYQKNNEESQYRSRKNKRRWRRKPFAWHEYKRELNEHRSERKCRNQEDDHYLGNNLENIKRYTCLCWEDYVCEERKHCLNKFKVLYGTTTSFFEYQSPIFQQADNFMATNVRHDSPRELIRVSYKKLKDLNHYLIAQLIKGKLLAHDFNELSVAVLGLTYTPKAYAELFWKIGNLILSHSKDSQVLQPLYDNLLKNVMNKYNGPEFMLNTAIRNIDSKKNIEEAYQLITSSISKKELCDSQYLGLFYGQLEHVLWKQDVQLLKVIKEKKNAPLQWGEDGENDEVMQKPQETVDSEFIYHGERAMHHLKLVEERLGVFDKALISHVELTNYFKGFDESLKVLRQHLQNNPTNPNSMKLLILALKSSVSSDVFNIDTEKEVMGLLEQLSITAPTCEHIKELILIYKEKGNFKKAIALLLQRIDHRALRNSYFDWKELYHIASMNKNNPVMEYLKEQITFRCGWIDLHFSKIGIVSSDINMETRALFKLKKDLYAILDIGTTSVD